MSPADFCYDTDASFSYAWLTCQLSTRYAAFLHHRGSAFTDFLYDSTSGISSRAVCQARTPCIPTCKLWTETDGLVCLRRGYPSASSLHPPCEFLRSGRKVILSKSWRLLEYQRLTGKGTCPLRDLWWLYRFDDLHDSSS